MFGRWAANARRPRRVTLRDDDGGAERQQIACRCGKAGETFREAGRHEDALVAIHRHRRVMRAARHIGIIRHGHRGLTAAVIRHGHDHVMPRHRRIGWRRRHRQPGRRRQGNGGAENGREDSPYGQPARHAPTFSRICGGVKSHATELDIAISGLIGRSPPSVPRSSAAGRPCRRTRWRARRNGRRDRAGFPPPHAVALRARPRSA